MILHWTGECLPFCFVCFSLGKHLYFQCKVHSQVFFYISDRNKLINISAIKENNAADSIFSVSPQWLDLAEKTKNNVQHRQAWWQLICCNTNATVRQCQFVSLLVGLLKIYIKMCFGVKGGSFLSRNMAAIFVKKRKKKKVSSLTSDSVECR